MRTPVLPSTGALRPASATVEGGFWAARDANVVIEHCLESLEREGWIQNFRDFGGRGREFADSEVYKTLEAMAWASHSRLDEVARVVKGAQQPDGYLNTRFKDARYTDLEWGHELYCYGHLIQAGVAGARSGGSSLVEIAIRAADHVVGFERYCGHPGIEMALVELYRVTGSSKYLDQAKSFVDRRGSKLLGDIAFGRAYFQDDMPVRERRVFAGHAVRELYLACGAVDVAVETGDSVLLKTIIEQYDRTLERRTYITGGMGSRRADESFGEDFELPPEGAYSETCAGIASVMLAWRLLLATGSHRWADVIERTLYNVVAASPSADCRSFFYANPLGWSGRDSGRFEVAGQRAPWFEVSCCPTNLARTFASLACYLATSTDDGVQIHQYAPGVVRAGDIELRVETAYPWDGRVTVTVVETPAREWELKLRVPGSGYQRQRKRWRPGDSAVLELPVSLRLVEADPRIEAVRGCVAVERGPLVYCAETTVADGVTTLVPYHSWANRGPSTMRVWVPLTTGA
ncbi:glycoside hydrolase family 127 protein [Allorhizocola rhizosphaerae]|uniref:glycoside hydrolase family 127 protein n=1 Tax=Allorhizocola rhizosphaerae TaxID=1872709 RepID=UPI000E3D8524|nr:beta-L-arabinofuranosidase domain-containing protein [Allorhizocola rhizosphaerae]